MLRVCLGYVLGVDRESAAESVDSRRGSEAAMGAVAGAVGVLAVMPFFYPFGRVFDPTVGGDTPSGLLTELTIGFVGGIILAPLAGLIGAAVAYCLGGRRVGAVGSVLLVMLATAMAIGLLVVFNGGFVDGAGSLKSLQWIAALGALAGTAAVCIYQIAQRAVLPRLAALAIQEQTAPGLT